MSPRTILICDDEIELARELCEWFELSGWSAVTAGSAAEARDELLRGAAPDVLLSDRRMPGEDGDSLLIFARSLPDARRPRVTALMSGDARLDTKPCPAGVDFVFLKPVDPDQIRDAFLRSLDNTGTRINRFPQG